MYHVCQILIIPILSVGGGKEEQKTDAQPSGLSDLQVNIIYMSLVMRKPAFRVSVMVLHNPSCTATRDG